MTRTEYNRTVDHFSDGVYRFILKMCKSKEMAEDVVQDSFMKLWEEVEYIAYDKAKSFLFSTAYHRMIDVLRRETKFGDIENVADRAGDDPVRTAFGEICSRPGGGGTEREVNLMEEKDVQRLLDMLYSMIDEAKSAAFSSDKCVISRDEALDLLDDIRAKLPLEIKKAQELVRAREEYVSSAKKEVEKMLRQAELDAKVIVSESETLQQARRKSSEIIRRAEERSKELYHVANTYTEDALRRTEEAIQAALDEVKESRVRFRATSNEQMQANQEKLRERRSASEQPQSDENA